MSGVLAAELTKLRTLRSTFWNLLVAVLLGAGLAALVAWSFRSSAGRHPDFDPLFATFYSLTLAQLPLVVLAVLAVTGEYGAGTIAASLLAVPSRGRFYLAKLAATALTLGAASLVVVSLTVVVAQAVLGRYAVGLGDHGVLRAVVGAWLYLTGIGLFAFGTGALLRSTVLTLAVLLPVLLLGSQGLGNIPKVKNVTQFLPDQTGWVILHLTASPGGDPRFARPYGPWQGLGLTALWAVAALLAGYLAVRRRDV